jgi:hypothetical protein
MPIDGTNGIDQLAASLRDVARQIAEFGGLVFGLGGLGLVVRGSGLGSCIEGGTCAELLRNHGNDGRSKFALAHPTSPIFIPAQLAGIGIQHEGRIPMLLKLYVLTDKHVMHGQNLKIMRPIRPRYRE